jgi:uncharacterized cupredoxin-like copper-binding protein
MHPGQARRRDVALIVAGGILAGAGTANPRYVDWSKALRVEVTMVEYGFTPNHLTFRLNVPYRLHLENRGKELHEFTAPAFFQAVTLRDRHVLWTGGQEVVVQPGASADIDLLPRRPGRFELRCADHDWAGMTGEIIVQ